MDQILLYDATVYLSILDLIYLLKNIFLQDRYISFFDFQAHLQHISKTKSEESQRILYKLETKK